MAEAVYILCGVTSVCCAILLLRGYRQSRTKLLFWSSLCFVGLALNNVLLFVDLIIVPAMDLSLARNFVALLAMMILLFGLIWERQ
jgi:hypothetical protein